MDAHPAWWAAAADLRPGDRLHTPDGWAEVDKVVPRPGTDRVYNLTVEHEHLFRVGRDALLVHNSCPRKNEILEHLRGHGKRYGDLDDETLLRKIEQVWDKGVPYRGSGGTEYRVRGSTVIVDWPGAPPTMFEVDLRRYKSVQDYIQKDLEEHGEHWTF